MPQGLVFHCTDPFIANSYNHRLSKLYMYIVWMVQLAMFLNIIGMTTHSYTICLSEKISCEMEAEHQDDKHSGRHVEISVPCHQFKTYSSEIFTTYISSAFLRWAKDGVEDTSCFEHHAAGGFQPPFRCSYSLIHAATTRRAVYGANWFKVVRLKFQHICTTTTAILLILALLVNTIAAVRNPQIMPAVRRIVTRETMFNVVSVVNC